jgi:hypothetical protein
MVLRTVTWRRNFPQAIPDMDLLAVRDPMSHPTMVAIPTENPLLKVVPHIEKLRS